MDKYIYTALSGMKSSMHHQTMTTYNLANVNTVGFRKHFADFQSVHLKGAGLESRVQTRIHSEGVDLTPGYVKPTQRSLDVALGGAGFFAVQNPEGAEAYTVRGDLRVGTTGLLENGSGAPVLGDKGTITIPEASNVNVGRDGTITVVPFGGGPKDTEVVGRLKVVSSPTEPLKPGVDGLLYTTDGKPLEADPSIEVKSGFLEQSNVSPTEALVQMLWNAREYEMHVKMLKTSEDIDRAGTSLLKIDG